MVPGKVTVKGIRCFPHFQERKSCTQIISSTPSYDLARVELGLEYSVHILVFTTSAIRSMQGPVSKYCKRRAFEAIREDFRGYVRFPMYG